MTTEKNSLTLKEFSSLPVVSGERKEGKGKSIKWDTDSEIKKK